MQSSITTVGCKKRDLYSDQNTEKVNHPNCPSEKKLADIVRSHRGLRNSRLISHEFQLGWLFSIVSILDICIDH